MENKLDKLNLDEPLTFSLWGMKPADALLARTLIRFINDEKGLRWRYISWRFALMDSAHEVRALTTKHADLIFIDQAYYQTMGHPNIAANQAVVFIGGSKPIADDLVSHLEYPIDLSQFKHLIGELEQRLLNSRELISEINPDSASQMLGGQAKLDAWGLPSLATHAIENSSARFEAPLNTLSISSASMVRLKRWPTTAFLTTAVRIKMATILTGRHIRVSDLSQKSGQPEHACEQFVRELQLGGLIDIEIKQSSADQPVPELHSAAESAVVAALQKSPVATKKPARSLLALIRHRFGLT